EKFTKDSKTLGITREYKIDFEGVATFIEETYHKNESASLRRWAKDYMDKILCPECEGSRLRKESLYFKVNGKNIAELAQKDIVDLAEWFKKLEPQLSKKQKKIASEVIKEISVRLQFLVDVGLNYLSLNRG
ncbi:excinuclease ABC subunit UvrA, partial [Tamlana crocina]|nr:excinuclease ABC subunit UvrA [Tamlana crocina]